METLYFQDVQVDETLHVLVGINFDYVKSTTDTETEIYKLHSLYPDNKVQEIISSFVIKDAFIDSDFEFNKYIRPEQCRHERRFIPKQTLHAGESGVIFCMNCFSTFPERNEVIFSNLK